jgi:hypothetical protein
MKVFANILALYAQICGGSINNTPIGNVTRPRPLSRLCPFPQARRSMPSPQRAR